MSLYSERQALAARLRALRGPLPSVTIGFDGFVDEMIRVVDERTSLDHYRSVRGIADFGRIISRAAGHSALREIVVTATHPGGCTINMGDGLAALGVPVDAFATLGTPAHPAFAQVTRRFRSTHSWGREPGRTLAFEFEDGKLMFSAVTQLAEFTPESVRAQLTAGTFQKSCATAGLIALTDWSLYPHMTAVWNLLVDEVFARMTTRPNFFFDLVDPSGRSPEDIRAMLALLGRFAAIGRVTLGLNGNEANLIATLSGIAPNAADCADASPALASAIRYTLDVSEVVIHQPRYAALATRADACLIAGPYCAQPKKSTGAGDRFNAGYALGLLADAPPVQRLLCGAACSGFFVREARSGGLPELMTFIENGDWDQP